MRRTLTVVVSVDGPVAMTMLGGAVPGGIIANAWPDSAIYQPYA